MKDKCPACGCNVFVDVAAVHEVSRTNFPEEVERRYYACSWCGLIGKDDQITNDELRAFYATSYQFQTGRHPACWDRAAAFIARNLPRAHLRSALDVGSKGDELSGRLADQGVTVERWEGLDARPTSGSIRSAWVGDGQGGHGKDIDLVTACHVLEHAVDPFLFMQDVRDMLSLRGFAYIEVPSVEGHAEMLGSCDNINREHLWSFSTNALMRLFGRAGLVVLAHETGWQTEGPVHRSLVSMVPVSDQQFKDGLYLQDAEHDLAAHKISRSDPAKTGLYATSYNYLKLRRVAGDPLKRFRAFDLYRHGAEIGGVKVEHPDALAGLESVWVCTRFWNAFQDIRKWFSEHHPEIKVTTPFRM